MYPCHDLDLSGSRDHSILYELGGDFGRGVQTSLELEFGVKGRHTLVPWIVNSSSPVESEDVAEQIRVSVEEIFAAVDIEEELLLVGAEQRVWKPVDGAAPRLETLAADVES